MKTISIRQLRTCFIVLFLLQSVNSYAQQRITVSQISSANKWTDSVLNTMSVDQRIGQLFVVTAYSNRDYNHVRQITELVRDYKIGGVMFASGGPVRQALLTNYFQSQANVPLMISMDAEWGLSMRLDSTMNFPRESTLGAIQDDQLIYKLGLEIARQLRRMGIHMSFSPDADINNNPWNPVINERSFGQDKRMVARKSVLYMQGLQDGGVIACAKHFPGHGDTDQDSHQTLPIINKNKALMDSVELFPFKELITTGVTAIMVGHLAVPAYDASGMPASLSYLANSSLLQRQLNFKGLVVTDALSMKGVSTGIAPSDLALKAFLAGNDILLSSDYIPGGIAEIKKAINRKQISIEDVNLRVKKILAAKFALGLNHYKPIVLKNLLTDLNTPDAKNLNRELVKNAITLFRNTNDVLPIKKLDNQKIAAISIGSELDNSFLNTLKRYAPVKTFAMRMWAETKDFDSLLNNLRGYNTVIIGLHDVGTSSTDNYSISETARTFIYKLSQQTKVVFSVFGNPYCLTNFDYLSPVVIGFEDNTLNRSLAAQAIFGGIGVKGKLPVDVGVSCKKGEGVTTQPIRLEYALPESVGIHSADLSRIDSIAMDGITKKAYPGCVVLVAKDGKVFYEKAFGYHTFDRLQPEKTDDVFDLASVTKIAATTQGVMKLVENGSVDLNKTFGTYVPKARNYDKSNILIKDLMTHQAGLTPYIPFYRYISAADWSADSSAAFPTRVAEHYYMRKGYFEKVMLPEMLASKLKTPGKYEYSDLSMYFMQQVLENVTGQPLENYVMNTFYKPLGLTTMGYNPRNRLPLNRIVPTEDDKYFRKQLVHGDVHDQGAAMTGGVAGHAGLFSDANDLTVLMQMDLNGGEYGGQRYLRPETLEKFTVYNDPFVSRRGLGFDKPEVDLKERSFGATAKDASDETFGHTGFTGTCVWVDPKTNLIYVFLSNRVNSSSENNKLGSMGIRPKIHQVVYDALKKAEGSAVSN
ncbi:glycoside hydrolase family 3 N-terminal domain-containing protein [Solitalea koreensis]|uniref:beta-N-acetylhexosaminidase n=1 Tax=Solitalea koreensis TaxID=543615 RepID=A0A521CS13_9SPHI|nr:glycoside hydrolase family 3 N-terminal domain-containing protein [Solitalea koreensis]SMO62222.1 beta-glucosidase [Solitalea koreensis]